MRILYLAHRIPYPPNKGEKIRAYHEIRFLSSRHEVDVFCLAHDKEDLAAQSGLRDICRKLHVETLNPLLARLRALMSLGGSNPFSFAYFYVPSLAKAVRDALAENAYDVLFVYCSSMAPYVPRPTPVPLVFDFVDIDSAKWLQYARMSFFPLSRIYSREGRLLGEWENRLAEQSAAVVVSTLQEAALLAPQVQDAIQIIPNGVGVPEESSSPELPETIRQLQPYFVFVGSMDYRPNADAVQHFAEEILPRVRKTNPRARFVIVGRRPARRIRRLHGRDGIVVTGEVADIQPYLRGAVAAVAPFRISQGVQNKILEALAVGLPVVASPRPAEAIGAEPGKTLLVAETDEEFADALRSLLEKPALRSQFLSTARQFVRQRFDWGKSLVRLEEVLQAAMTAPSSAGSKMESHAALR